MTQNNQTKTRPDQKDGQPIKETDEQFDAKLNNGNDNNDDVDKDVIMHSVDHVSSSPSKNSEAITEDSKEKVLKSKQDILDPDDNKSVDGNDEEVDVSMSEKKSSPATESNTTISISNLLDSSSRKESHPPADTLLDGEANKIVADDDPAIKVIEVVEGADATPNEGEMSMSEEPSTTNVKQKRLRRSYNCGPCKKQKTKCDMKIPCGNCIKHNKTDQCLLSPPQPPSEEQLKTKQIRQWKRLEKLRREQEKNMNSYGTSVLHLDQASNPHLQISVLPQQHQFGSQMQYQFQSSQPPLANHISQHDSNADPRQQQQQQQYPAYIHHHQTPSQVVYQHPPGAQQQNSLGYFPPQQPQPQPLQPPHPHQQQPHSQPNQHSHPHPQQQSHSLPQLPQHNSSSQLAALHQLHSYPPYMPNQEVAQVHQQAPTDPHVLQVSPHSFHVYPPHTPRVSIVAESNTSSGGSPLSVTGQQPPLYTSHPGPIRPQPQAHYQSHQLLPHHQNSSPQSQLIHQHSVPNMIHRDSTSTVYSIPSLSSRSSFTQFPTHAQQPRPQPPHLYEYDSTRTNLGGESAVVYSPMFQQQTSSSAHQQQPHAAIGIQAHPTAVKATGPGVSQVSPQISQNLPQFYPVQMHPQLSDGQSAMYDHTRNRSRPE